MPLKPQKRTGLIFFPAFDWAISPNHPEREERLLYTQDQVFEEGLLDFDNIREYKPGIATAEDINRAHICVPDAGSVVTESHLISAGGAITAAQKVLSGEVDNAFALVRPPGHHAQAAEAAGFCIFNNIAIGARHALARWGMERILIVDWDLHHGNGTAETFYEDRKVLYFSTHQSPGYPGTGGMEETGSGPGLGYTINVPLRPGADDAFYVRVFREILCPVAREFRPEIILVSAGFDIYIGDPLGEMKVTPEGFACLTRILLNLADECCNGRLVLVLEGGYNILGLTRSVRAVLLELLGETRVTEETLSRMAANTDETCNRLIGRVREKIGPFWPVF